MAERLHTHKPRYGVRQRAMEKPAAPGKPIPFSAPMVRAILDGRKTVTRRVMKPQFPDWVNCAGFTCFTPPRSVSGRGTYVDDDGVNHGPAEKFIRLPYAFGDRLWVREAWRTEARFDHLPPRDVPRDALVSYEADYDQEPNDGCRGRYRHARFMPRWASRITLDVTSVKVERLQEISEDDAVAEGIAPYLNSMSYTTPKWTDGKYRCGDNAYELFRDLWQSIHGPDSWEANPWVAAVSFKRIP